MYPPDSSTYDTLTTTYHRLPNQAGPKACGVLHEHSSTTIRRETDQKVRQNLLTDRYTPFDIDKENLIGSLGEESSHITCRSGRCCSTAATLLSALMLGRAQTAILHARPAIEP